MNSVFIIIFLATTLAVLPFLRSVIKRGYEGNFFQKLTWSGRLVILSGIILIAASISQYEDSVKTTQVPDDLKIVTNTPKLTSPATLGLDADRGAGSIEKVESTDNTTTEEEEPLLDISGNPHFIEDGDSTTIALNIKNYSSRNARNVDAEVMILQKINDKFKVLGKFNEEEERIFLAAHKTYLYLINDHFHGAKDSNSNNFYFFFKINYTNESGNKQPPLRKIYPIPYPNAGVYIQSLKDVEAYQVETFLVQNNYW